MKISIYLNRRVYVMDDYCDFLRSSDVVVLFLLCVAFVFSLRKHAYSNIKKLSP